MTTQSDANDPDWLELRLHNWWESVNDRERFNYMFNLYKTLSKCLKKMEEMKESE